MAALGCPFDTGTSISQPCVVGFWAAATKGKLTWKTSLANSQLNADGEIDTLRSIEQGELHAGDGGVVLDAQAFTGVSILYGGAGDDDLLGGINNDQLYGFAGNDVLNAGDGHDWLLGSAGKDTLLGGNGNDNLRGQGGSGDDLTGGPGIDRLDGGAGPDIIRRDGDDIVINDNSDILLAQLNAAFVGADDWLDVA